MAASDYRPLLRGGAPASEAEPFDMEGGDGGGTTVPLVSPSQAPALTRQVSIGERLPPEWALLLLGCALGLATGMSLVLFNLTVSVVHDLCWAGTPSEGATWFRKQRLSETWHRIMLVPVLGGVVVGMLHALIGIIEQNKGSNPPFVFGRYRIDWQDASRPFISAVQAAVTLGTGSSLGPEGPSVDIGKSWAEGLGEVMRNSRDRRLALVAAGAAAGISSGFDAPVAGCFFAIETVLQSSPGDSAPPLTTAMIILASVLSSAVSQVLRQFLGMDKKGDDKPAFTVPKYELKSATELPLYLLLGMVCGIVAIILTRLIKWSSAAFDFLRERLGIPAAVTPALGGLCVGAIALRYPGVLYWGFHNVDEILHAREKSGPKYQLILQLAGAKIVATALCRGSGLVGGIYAPSLFIGSAVGSVYGSMASAAIMAAVPGGNADVAAPQAYALVGMAALLASACSVPLTSVLLLFELTKDYRILLPLMGAVGLAFWVSSVANRKKGPLLTRLTSGSLQPVAAAMRVTYAAVRPDATLNEAVQAMSEHKQRCCLVVDHNNLLEGIITLSDLQQQAVQAAMARGDNNDDTVDVQSMPVTAVCSGKAKSSQSDLVVCFPDMSLRTARRLMAPCGLHQLPVVSRGGAKWQERGRKVVGLLDAGAISLACRSEATRRLLYILHEPRDDYLDRTLIDDSHNEGSQSGLSQH
eukprot:SM000240S08622  [mRNA]  locus=s240:19332:23393:- [translate_table: standard]